MLSTDALRVILFLAAALLAPAQVESVLLLLLAVSASSPPVKRSTHYHRTLRTKATEASYYVILLLKLSQNLGIHVTALKACSATFLLIHRRCCYLPHSLALEQNPTFVPSSRPNREDTAHLDPPLRSDHEFSPQFFPPKNPEDKDKENRSASARLFLPKKKDYRKSCVISLNLRFRRSF